MIEIADDALRSLARAASARASELHWPFFAAFADGAFVSAAMREILVEFLRACAKRSLDAEVRAAPRREYSEISDATLRGLTERVVSRCAELGMACVVAVRLHPDASPDLRCSVVGLGILPEAGSFLLLAFRIAMLAIAGGREILDNANNPPLTN